jgi:serine/threonine protein kinase
MTNPRTRRRVDINISVRGPIAPLTRSLFDLQEVRLLAYSLCRALGILWSIKLVHRDIRPPNVMRLPEPYRHYILIDLEHVAPVAVWPREVAPLNSWDSHTLNDKGEYDHRSDMHQLGEILNSMLCRVGAVSSEAKECVTQMRQKMVDWDGALKLPWLVGVKC